MIYKKIMIKIVIYITLIIPIMISGTCAQADKEKTLETIKIKNIPPPPSPLSLSLSVNISMEVGNPNAQLQGARMVFLTFLSTISIADNRIT